MLDQLAARGPDSAGVALYRAPLNSGLKLSVLSSSGHSRWPEVAGRLDDSFGTAGVLFDHGDHAILTVDADSASVRGWLTEFEPDVIVLASGGAIELHKRVGKPAALVDGCGIRSLGATHGLGHTRMATESRVSIAGSHPFSPGEDLCLVHNGSLSNHNRLRRELRRQGITFTTDNDSEVAAGYLSWRLREGDTLEAALHSAVGALDGFYTFAVGTRDGLAVLRDPVACKPAVMAETDDWVAMASEYRAIAVLPGASEARMWEPEPAQIYTWSRVGAPA
jgi:glutamate synthase domain-containing protein 1